MRGSFMQLISTNVSLRAHLGRLIKQYPNIAFGVAWASAATDAFATLVQQRSKIQGAVVGTHFYQTHPDVLDEFVGSEVVKFVLQPAGVFHPKVYAFWDDKHWEVLIGSANLTVGALTANTELSILITDADDTRDLKDEVLDLVRKYSAAARTINQDEADRYRRLWKLKQPELGKLADHYGGTIPTKPAVDSAVRSMSWAQFFERIQKEKTHGFTARCNLLKTVNAEFQKTAHFSDMDPQIRLGIAGLRSTLENALWFGSMIGAGYFYQAINKNDPHISLALDKVPLTGQVTKSDFNAYVEQYLKAFPSGRDGIGTASRLLALKRPDTFVCVDSKNRDRLTKDFGIKKGGLDYDRYWNEVVERLMDSPWWSSPEPINATERDAWTGRAAMLDAIFYQE